MKETKYRAWHIKEKRMYDVWAMDSMFGEFTDHENQHVKVTLFLKGYYDKSTSPLKKFYPDAVALVPRIELIIMQYTGLKDSEGAEIYEGDKVEFYVNGNEKEGKEIGIIEYSDRKAMFMFRINDHEKVSIFENIPHSLSMIDPPINCKVIGHIYEKTKKRAVDNN